MVKQGPLKMVPSHCILTKCRPGRPFTGPMSYADSKIYLIRHSAKTWPGCFLNLSFFLSPCPLPSTAESLHSHTGKRSLYSTHQISLIFFHLSNTYSIQLKLYPINLLALLYHRWKHWGSQTHNYKVRFVQLKYTYFPPSFFSFQSLSYPPLLPLEFMTPFLIVIVTYIYI